MTRGKAARPRSFVDRLRGNPRSWLVSHPKCSTITDPLAPIADAVMGMAKLDLADLPRAYDSR